MIKAVSDNENVLKNITNKNLKSIFEVINKTLMYIETKHFKPKRPKTDKKINSPVKELES